MITDEEMNVIRKVAAILLVAGVAMVGRAMAHEGHEHKIMGKVVAIDEKTIAVEGLDGKKVSGALSASTKYMRDKLAVARTDIKVGERVVIVVVEEKQVQNVKQVLLGTATTEEHKGEHKH
jgi:hypothetical protein